MAETAEGKKKVYVHPHKREDGTKVKRHYRSTPNTSSGKKSKWCKQLKMSPNREKTLLGLFLNIYKTKFNIIYHVTT